MSRLYQRVVIPLVVATLLLCGYILSSHTPKDTLINTGSHIIDSFAHITDTTSSQKEQAGPNGGTADNLASGKKTPTTEETKEEVEVDPCTVINPSNHGFIDMRALSSIENDGKALPWISRGYESGYNYTIGICSNPFKRQHEGARDIQDNVNASSIGAFYVDPKTSKYVSMGEFSTTPKFIGKKLTLTYENGSYCENTVNSATGERMRKSTILKFTCDREMMAKAAVSFIGSFNDCHYVFEVRSHYACPAAPKSNNLAVIWIFLLIVSAAVLVYVSGGLLYKQMKKQNKAFTLKA
ncbi:mannose 6-phosphate receptor domain-containing protein [Suhomyces tanzawaensis NRRL Y-17324]|uniref:Mannose 6-phosphate receptor domain-containing protein n=1 Tax=Suhomyces tanzawaensis NRRL Y-17324 TaxID=984487 RepID=A0A1E4SN56_9ASCO|nr:mannose 6-phosphate receptor domain-containing protein [Suhomyces tanzawaensis NRRL Y-17324]ODV80918.1 mannose 6-phosphate receptor domain-containing protein [Suhomyces tanzawaensis NRRL Y-17324]